MTNYHKIILKAGKEKSPKNFHPWLFSGAIAKTEGNPVEGDIVEVYSSSDEFLAMGHFHKGTITVRIFSFEKTEAKFEFWKNKLQSAYNLRRNLNLINNSLTNVYRLIHAEGDGMPGLIIDYYNGIAVLQTHTLGMHKIKHHLVQALQEIYAKELKAVFDKSAETMKKQTGMEMENQFLFGEEYENIVVNEYGNNFNVNSRTGQKTGFFIDQRENRKLLATYCEGKSVLNTFCYTGGFSVFALNASASLVHSVDSSASAIEMTEHNVALNENGERHTSFTENVFQFIKMQEQKYDIIILDPPAFAKHLSALKQASIAYRNLNAEAIKKVNKGGLIFTFSCSQVIDRMLFRKIIFASAAMTGRNVRILHQLSQPADHPVSIYHPEGEYLKGLVLYVE
ncbi:MAG: class I SAM-dependent rRNA methyltransferase [Bacteroidia bacterium]